MSDFKNSLLSCKVLSLDLDGFGKVQNDNSTLNCRVPFIIEGEEIEFNVDTKSSFKDLAVVPKIIKPSEFRVHPACKHYTNCGGCVFQHLSFEYYAKFKTKTVLQLLNESQIQFSECEVKFIGEGLRRRAKRYAKKNNNKISLGLHKLRGFCVANINYCNVIRPELNNITDPLREVLDQVLNDKQDAVVNLLLASNAIDVGLEIRQQHCLNDHQKNMLRDFAKECCIGRIQFRSKRCIENIYSAVEPYVIVGGYEVPVNSWCFLQPSFESEEFMVKYVFDAIGGSIKIADLFSGRGTFSLPLSKMSFVNAYEMDNGAIGALQTVIFRNQLKSIVANRRNLFTNPLNVDELLKYDAVVVNPPRSGAENQMQFIGSSGVSIVVYISCDLQSFIRDAKIACVGGYKISKLVILDQFLWGPHVELIAIMHK